MVPERVHNPPNQQQPTRDLHECSHDGCAHEAEKRVQDFENREGLRGEKVGVVDFVEDGWKGGLLGEEEGCVGGACGPEGEGEGVVGEEVEAC